jgi:dihydrofolate reductase
MRNLVLKMSISADGFVGGPHGEIDWLLRTRDENAVAWILDTLRQAGVHIMGSRTFHDMAAYWPTSTDPLAVPMNEIPKVVFSKKGFQELSGTKWTTRALGDAIQLDAEKGINKVALSPGNSSWTNVSVASGNLADEISRLKQQDGNFILAHGGASFARGLVKHGLIDEYRLVIHPVILGQGLPLFSKVTHPFDLKLISSVVFKTGVIANIYRPVTFKK